MNKKWEDKIWNRHHTKTYHFRQALIKLGLYVPKSRKQFTLKNVKAMRIMCGKE